MRFLLLSCTERKSTEPELLPAIERYDGPSFRVVRKYLNTVSQSDLSVWIISAEYGLISSAALVPEYDRLMTRERADVLRHEVVSELRAALENTSPTKIFILLGKNYQMAIQPINTWIPRETMSIETAQGGSGQKLTALKNWLYGFPPTQRISQEVMQPMLIEEGDIGTAVLRGTELRYTLHEIRTWVEQTVGDKNAMNHPIREWVAQVGEHQVSPKWLVSGLSGLPVSRFSADEARRVLRQLGVIVMKTSSHT